MSEEEKKSKFKSEELDNLVDAGGDLLKAAGGVLGAAGKLALKVGKDVKDKVTDPEFQEAVKEKAEEITTDAVETIKETSKIVAEYSWEEAEKHANDPIDVKFKAFKDDEEPAIAEDTEVGNEGE